MDMSNIQSDRNPVHLRDRMTADRGRLYPDTVQHADQSHSLECHADSPTELAVGRMAFMQAAGSGR